MGAQAQREAVLGALYGLLALAMTGVALVCLAAPGAPPLDTRRLLDPALPCAPSLLLVLKPRRQAAAAALAPRRLNLSALLPSSLAASWPASVHQAWSRVG